MVNARVLVFVAALAGSAIGQESHNITLDEVLDGGWASLDKLKSCEYTFEHRGDAVGVSKIDVLLSGDKYYMSRQDLIAARLSDGILFSEEVAFDGARQQDLRHHNKAANLRDGLDGLVWGVSETPQTMIYFWITTWGRSPRFSEIRERKAWDKRFETAKLVGESDKFLVPAVGVEFLPYDSSKTWSYVVWFAKDLGFVPIASDRRIVSTQQISSSLRVTDYVTKDVDGKPLLFPIQLEFNETGLDKLSYTQKFSMTVDPSSLKVNEPLNETRFKLKIPEDYEVYDEQMIEASVEKAEELAEAYGSPRGSRDSWLGALFFIANGAMLLAAAGYLMRKRRNS